MKTMTQTYKYHASGLVYGKLWGGGYGSYPAIKLEADTREDLKKQIETALKDGSLDAGMGYEQLLGALMEIKTVETRIIEGKKYTHRETELELYGDLDEKAQDFLQDVWYQDL